MKRLWIVLFLCFVIPLSASGSATSQAEFEIRVGDTVYEAVPDKPFSIVTPKGERLELVLRRRKVLRFADHGISFHYPRAMKVSSEKSPGGATIYLESTGSPFAMIQLYPAPNTVEGIRAILMKSFRNEFKSRKAEFLKGSGKTVMRRIHGVEREGQVLEFILGGQRMKTEIYTLSKGGKVVAVILQHDLEDAELAKKYFSVITDTLE